MQGSTQLLHLGTCWIAGNGFSSRILHEPVGLSEHTAPESRKEPVPLGRGKRSLAWLYLSHLLGWRSRDTQELGNAESGMFRFGT